MGRTSLSDAGTPSALDVGAVHECAQFASNLVEVLAASKFYLPTAAQGARMAGVRRLELLLEDSRSPGASAAYQTALFRMVMALGIAKSLSDLKNTLLPRFHRAALRYAFIDRSYTELAGQLDVCEMRPTVRFFSLLFLMGVLRAELQEWFEAGAPSPADAKEPLAIQWMSRLSPVSWADVYTGRFFAEFVGNGNASSFNDDRVNPPKGGRLPGAFLREGEKKVSTIMNAAAPSAGELLRRLWNELDALNTAAAAWPQLTAPDLGGSLRETIRVVRPLMMAKVDWAALSPAAEAAREVIGMIASPRSKRMLLGQIRSDDGHRTLFWMVFLTYFTEKIERAARGGADPAASDSSTILYDVIWPFIEEWRGGGDGDKRS